VILFSWELDAKAHRLNEIAFPVQALTLTLLMALLFASVTAIKVDQQGSNGSHC
jgi:hypothetical protein